MKSSRSLSFTKLFVVVRTYVTNTKVTFPLDILWNEKFSPWIVCTTPLNTNYALLSHFLDHICPRKRFVPRNYLRKVPVAVFTSLVNVCILWNLRVKIFMWPNINSISRFVYQLDGSLFCLSLFCSSSHRFQDLKPIFDQSQGGINETRFPDLCRKR